MLPLPDIADEHGLAYQPQSELSIVADDLSVKVRVSLYEIDPESELTGEEIARRLDIGDEQLRG